MPDTAYKVLFLDESGEIDASTRAGMAVVVLLVADILQVKRVMRSTRRRYRRDLPVGKTYKAKNAPVAVTRYILEQVSTMDCEIIILRMGRRSLRRFGGDRNELYAAMVEEAIERAWERQPEAKPILHQRYEQEHLRNRITQRLLRRAQSLHLQLSPEEVQHRRASAREPGLEVVDAVAWTFTQQRRRNKARAHLYELIRSKVVVDDVFGGE